MQKLVGFLRLMRLANIVTAVSDILAGVTIAGYVTNWNWSKYQLQPVLFLILATIGLYGGGVVLNDVFDAELDAVERPERPIPSGLISKASAAWFGTFLLTGGILAAAMAGNEVLVSLPAIIATAIAIGAVVYDKWSKHHDVLGPLNMGICRGLNLALGMSIIPAFLAENWFICLIPVIYIIAITMISRGEVHGGKKNILYGAIVLYSIVIISILFVSYENGFLKYAFPFLLLFSIMIFPPLQKAVINPAGPLIGKAVKAGVIALILMNAAWAAAFGFIYVALLIMILLPLSMFLAKLFAVT